MNYHPEVGNITGSDKLNVHSLLAKISQKEMVLSSSKKLGLDSKENNFKLRAWTIKAITGLSFL